MNRKDYLLLVVAAAGSTPLTPVQLQKSLFLVKENLPEIPVPFYEFEPYDYGPFDVEVYSDADSLASEGLLLSVRSPLGNWIDRAVTPGGMKKVDRNQEGTVRAWRALMSKRWSDGHNPCRSTAW